MLVRSLHYLSSVPTHSLLKFFLGFASAEIFCDVVLMVKNAHCFFLWLFTSNFQWRMPVVFFSVYNATTVLFHHHFWWNSLVCVMHFFRVLSCSNAEDNSCFRNRVLLGGSSEMHNQIQWSNQSKEAFHGLGWLECTHGPGNEIPKPNSKWKSSLHTSVANRRTFVSRSRTFSYASESDRPSRMHLESWHWIMPCHLLFHPWRQARVFIYICISFVYSPENAGSCQFYPLIPHCWIVSFWQQKNYCNIIGDLMTVLSICPAKWISFLYAEMSYLC